MPDPNFGIPDQGRNARECAESSREALAGLRHSPIAWMVAIVLVCMLAVHFGAAL